jgi:hypothetical protein
MLLYVTFNVPTNLPPLSEVMAQLKPLAEAVQKLPRVRHFKLFETCYFGIANSVYNMC